MVAERAPSTVRYPPPVLREDLDPREFVPLTTCRDDAEVIGIRSLLEAEGIRVFVQGEHHRAVTGRLFGAMVELRVFVERADLEDARELLEEVEYAEHLPPENVEADPKDRSLQRFLEEHDELERLVEPDLPKNLSPRRPWVAVVIALFVPFGLAHLYARRPGRALVLFVLLVTTWALEFTFTNVWYIRILLVSLDAFGAVRAIKQDRAKGYLEGLRRAQPTQGPSSPE